MKRRTASFVYGVLIAVFAGAGAWAAQSDSSAGGVIDDAVLNSKVKAELVKDPMTKVSDINVDVHDGIVQLSGFVDSDAARTEAEVVTKRVAGVTTVRNNLQLQSGQRTAGRVVDDAAITAKVKSALIANPLTKSHEIKVNTENGTVQLSGFVDSPDAKTEAARAAQSVPGVASVDNAIEVKR